MNTLRASGQITMINLLSDCGSRRKPIGKILSASASECYGHSAALHIRLVCSAFTVDEIMK